MSLSKTNRGLPPLTSSTQMVVGGTNSSQLVASFPAIQQVLLSNQGRPDLSSDGHSALASRPPAAGSSEPNFVKTLLASRVVQHMNRVQSQQVVDALDTDVLSSAPQNGTAVLNSPSDISVSNPDGAAVAACSDSAKVATAAAGGSLRPTADISAMTHENSLSRTLESGAPKASETNKSILNEHSYIQTTEVFRSRSELGDSTSGRLMGTTVFGNCGKSGEVVDGLANWGGVCSGGFGSTGRAVI